MQFLLQKTSVSQGGGVDRDREVEGAFHLSQKTKVGRITRDEPALYGRKGGEINRGHSQT